jgi:hypothetical protein
MLNSPPAQLSFDFGEEDIATGQQAPALAAPVTIKFSAPSEQVVLTKKAIVVSLCGVRAVHKQKKAIEIYRNIRESIRHIG